MKKTKSRRKRAAELPTDADIAFMAEDSLNEMTKMLRLPDEGDEESFSMLTLATQAGAMARLAQGMKQGKSHEEIAQEMANDAYREPDPDRAVALGLQAMAIDPDCVDAMTIVATLGASSQESQVSMLSQAVEVGARKLGRKFFQKNKGRFGAMLEAGPYVRARIALANAFWEAGEMAEAIRHFEALLELNPNDDQGVRYPLLGCYFCAGQLPGVRKLLQDYPGETTATFAWSRVLERFLSGDHEGAEREFVAARLRNAHVLGLLTGRRRPPAELPTSYIVGEDSEAQVCADILLPAWKANRAALSWLKSREASIIAPSQN